MAQLKTLIRPELRPEQWVFPVWHEPILIQPEGTVLYDDFVVTEAYAKSVLDEWLARVARGRLLTN